MGIMTNTLLGTILIDKNDPTHQVMIVGVQGQDAPLVLFEGGWHDYPPDGWVTADALPAVPDPELVGDGGGV